MTVDTQCCGDCFTLLFQLISTLGNTCTGCMTESHETEPTVSRGDQGKLSHFSIRPTKKPTYQQIRENEYCIWYKKYFHISVSNMNCTGITIITWWAFKKSGKCGSTYPSFGVRRLSWSMPWGKLIQVVKICCYTFKTIKFLIVYYNDIFSSY